MWWLQVGTVAVPKSRHVSPLPDNANPTPLVAVTPLTLYWQWPSLPRDTTHCYLLTATPARKRKLRKHGKGGGAGACCFSALVNRSPVLLFTGKKKLFSWPSICHRFTSGSTNPFFFVSRYSVFLLLNPSFASSPEVHHPARHTLVLSSQCGNAAAIS